MNECGKESEASNKHVNIVPAAGIAQLFHLVCDRACLVRYIWQEMFWRLSLILVTDAREPTP